MVDVDTTPLVVGPLLFAAAFQGRIKAINRQTGQPVWEQAASSYVDLAEGYGQVYLVDDVATVRAYDQQTSELVWRQDGLSRRGLGSPLAYSNYLLVGDRDGYLHVLAQSDGRFLARTKLDGDGLRSNFAEADGVVYVLGNGGSLTAVEILVR
jgi:outer membrane protein assembly factor BamB